MRKQNFKDKFDRRNVALQAYEDGNHYEPPKSEKTSGDSMLLQAKAYRDLANLRVIDVKADPNSELSYGSFPYTVIGKTNPVIDARYPGYANIAGNSITEIQNNTTSSQLMNIVDVAAVVKHINYNYLPIRAGEVNVALTGEMIKSIEQAVSFGFSTMLTQLAFSQNTYASDIPVPTSLANTQATGYYQALIHYQTVLQSMVQPMAKYIEMRSLEKELMRMSFRTEAPLITKLFGLFKKTSFVSAINTIGTVAINEYFDVNWYKQVNTLLCVPSRKTVGMVDPLLTMIGVHAIPSLTITDSANNKIYDSADLATSAQANLLDPEDFTIKTGSVSLENLILRVCKLMNPAYILRFVRLYNRNALPQGAINTISAYAESTKLYLDYISTFAAAFSTKMSDVRTFLDKLSQSGMVYWKKGVSFFVDKVNQLEPKYNALLNDVFQATYAGADTITFDANTKRWRAWVFWNKYTGIPEYDRMSGGSFLTFGLRNISSTDSDGNTVNFELSSGLIPVLFSHDANDSSNIIVTRTGVTANITAAAITNANLQTDHYLSRLNPLNNGHISLKQPNIQISISDATLRAKVTSALLMFIGNTFGFGRVQYSNTYDRVLDPDYVAFLDLEIEDVSNQMIKFARNYAPFRVSTPDGERTMGFSTTSGSDKSLREDY